MPKSLNILNDLEVVKIEHRIEALIAQKRNIDAEIDYAKGQLVKMLRDKEAATGEKYRTPVWKLGRSSTKVVRTVSISLLRKFVTEEIIARCCTSRRSTAPALLRVPARSAKS